MPLAEVGPRAFRIYWIAAVSEAVAIVGGSYLLRQADFGELGLPWMVTVIGAHFFPLAWATASQDLVLRARGLRGVGRTTSTGHGA